MTGGTRTGLGAFGASRFGVKDPPLVVETTKIGEFAIDPNDAQKDAREGQRQLIYIYRVAQEYESQSRKTFDGDEDFVERLSRLESDLERSLDPIVYNLARGVDHGNSGLLDLQKRLDAARRDLFRSSLPARTGRAFLDRFLDDLQRRRQVLDDALNAAASPAEDARARQDALAGVNQLLKAVKDQQTAVMQISRRVADLWDTMRRHIKPRMPGEEWDLADATESALQHAKKEFDDFQAVRRKALAQRDTNAEQFKDPPSKGLGLSSRFGTKAQGTTTGARRSLTLPATSLSLTPM